MFLNWLFFNLYSSYQEEKKVFRHQENKGQCTVKIFLPDGEAPDPDGEALDPNDLAQDPNGEALDPAGEAPDLAGEALDPDDGALDPDCEDLDPDGGECYATDPASVKDIDLEICNLLFKVDKNLIKG